ncbi:hypothetical protein B296_00035766 [Ensete ventricosum]|uniref:Uncharacterized protein n=1 Tax=Ensete ventricosum TaxID=4639 RepID=A0A426YE43_ENSVE|nr:hypothetical protein B296_00035766 [Ensete ventricosum]
MGMADVSIDSREEGWEVYGKSPRIELVLVPLIPSQQLQVQNHGVLHLMHLDLGVSQMVYRGKDGAQMVELQGLPEVTGLKPMHLIDLLANAPGTWMSKGMIMMERVEMSSLCRPKRDSLPHPVQAPSPQHDEHHVGGGGHGDRPHRLRLGNPKLQEPGRVLPPGYYSTLLLFARYALLLYPFLFFMIATDPCRVRVFRERWSRSLGLICTPSNLFPALLGSIIFVSSSETKIAGSSSLCSTASESMYSLPTRVVGVDSALFALLLQGYTAEVVRHYVIHGSKSNYGLVVTRGGGEQFPIVALIGVIHIDVGEELIGEQRRSASTAPPA